MPDWLKVRADLKPESSGGYVLLDQKAFKPYIQSLAPTPTSSGDANWTYPMTTAVTYTTNGQTVTWSPYAGDRIRYRKTASGRVVFNGAVKYTLSPSSGGTPTSTSVNTYGYQSNNWQNAAFWLFQIPYTYRPDSSGGLGGMPYWPTWRSASGNPTMGDAYAAHTTLITSPNYFRITPTDIALTTSEYSWWIVLTNVNLNPGEPLWFYGVSWFAEV